MDKNWKDVQVELPNASRDVLVSINGFVTIAAFSLTGKSFIDRESGDLLPIVTHWDWLPEPPVPLPPKSCPSCGHPMARQTNGEWVCRHSHQHAEIE